MSNVLKGLAYVNWRDTNSSPKSGVAYLSTDLLFNPVTQPISNRQLFKLDAGESIDFYFSGNDGGAGNIVSTATKVIVDVLYETGENVVQTLYSGSRPSNGSSYTFWATVDGSSTGNHIAGCYRPRVRVIKDNAATRVFHSVTEDWKRRIGLNSGTVSEATLAAVDEFVTGLSGVGLLNLVKRVNLFAGNNLNAALTPLIIGSEFGASDMDVNLSGNFKESDYNERGLNGGLKGDGLSKELYTNFAFTPGMFNNGYIGIYASNYELAGNQVMVMGVRDPGPSAPASRRMQLMVGTPNGLGQAKWAVVADAAQVTHNASDIGNNISSGMVAWIMRTTASSTLFINWNGLDAGNIVGTFTDQNPTGASLSIFGSGPNTSSPRSAMLGKTYIVSTGLSETQATDLYNRVLVFNRRLGRAVPDTQILGDYDINSDGKVGPQRGTISLSYSGAIKVNPTLLDFSRSQYLAGNLFAFGTGSDENIALEAIISRTHASAINDKVGFYTTLSGNIQDQPAFATTPSGKLYLNTVCDSRYQSKLLTYIPRVSLTGNSSLLTGERWAQFETEFAKNLANLNRPGKIYGTPALVSSVFPIFTYSMYFSGDALQGIKFGKHYNLNTGQFTIEAKIRLSGSRPNEIGTIISKWGQNLKRWRFYVSGVGNNLRFDINNLTVTGNDLSNDTNYDVAVSWNSGVVYLYSSGFLVGSGNLSSHQTGNSVEGWMGRDDTSGNAFKGFVNDIRISNSGRYNTPSYATSTTFSADSHTDNLWRLDTGIFRRVDDYTLQIGEGFNADPSLVFTGIDVSTVYNRSETASYSFGVKNARNDSLTRRVSWQIIDATGALLVNKSGSGPAYGNFGSGDYFILTGDYALHNETGAPWMIKTNISSGYNVSGKVFSVSSKILIDSGNIQGTGVNGRVNNNGLNVRNLSVIHSFSYALGHARGTNYAFKTGISRRILNTNSVIEDNVAFSTSANSFISDSYYIDATDISLWNEVGSPKTLIIIHSGNSGIVENAWGVSRKWRFSRSGSGPIDDMLYVGKLPTTTTDSFLSRNRSQTIYFSGYVFNINSELISTGAFIACGRSDSLDFDISGSPFTLTNGLYAGSSAKLSFSTDTVTGYKTLVISSDTGDGALFTRLGETGAFNFAESSFTESQFLVTSVLNIESRTQKTVNLNTGVSRDSQFTIGDNVIYAFGRVLDSSNDPISGVSCSFTQIDPNETIAQGPLVANTNQSGWTPNKTIRFDTRAPAGGGWVQRVSVSNYSGNSGIANADVIMISAFTANKNITIGVGPVIGAPNTLGYPVHSTQGNHARPGDRLIIGIVLAENGFIALPDTGTIPSIRLSRFNLATARLETLQSGGDWLYEGQSGFSEYYFPFKYTTESGRCWLLNFGTLSQGVTTGNGYLFDTAFWGGHVVYTMASLDYNGQPFRDDEWFPVVSPNSMHPYTTGSLPGEFVTKVFDGVDFAAGFPFR